MRHRTRPGARVHAALCALTLWASLALPLPEAVIPTPASAAAHPHPAPALTSPDPAPALASPPSALAMPSAIPDHEQRWLPPLEATPFELLDPFRAPPHEYGAGHRGIDLEATPGATVRAPTAGTVSFAGLVADRPVVSVRVDEQTVYSMEPVASDLQQGDAVGIGSPIGAVAGGGHCDARCLHLGIRVDDAYVNPMRYFVARPVLLPW